MPLELIARSKFSLSQNSRFKINTESRQQKKAIILGRGREGMGRSCSTAESHGTMNLFQRDGPIPPDYTPGHASFLRCVRKRLEGRHLTEQGMAIVRNIREETTQYVDRTFFRVATLPDNPAVCFLSSLCPVDCGGGLWSSARSTGKMKIPLCAGLHYARPTPSTACSAKPPTPNVGKRVKMTSTPRLRHFMRFLFFLLWRSSTRDSIFLRCLYTRACMCVRVCARGPMCTQGNTEKGVGFVERGIIRSIDEQNIFPSSFDRYYVLEFFDILKYWNRDAWRYGRYYVADVGTRLFCMHGVVLSDICM